MLPTVPVRYRQLQLQAFQLGHCSNRYLRYLYTGRYQKSTRYLGTVRTLPVPRYLPYRKFGSVKMKKQFCGDQDPNFCCDVDQDSDSHNLLLKMWIHNLILLKIGTVPVGTDQDPHTLKDADSDPHTLKDTDSDPHTLKDPDSDPQTLKEANFHKNFGLI